jgi:inhibitor of KinA
MALHLTPLGDQAVLARGADEAAALAFAGAVRRQQFPWVEDVVQAYASVAVFYTADVDFFQAKDRLASLEQTPILQVAGRDVTIPCCYDLGLDFGRITQHTRLTRDQVIAAHSADWYTVYAIGFCPGFPYLGYLREELAGVPRLPAPRLKVEAGSVGLTGRQTGIYTEARPGGWHIVGRTPLELVHVADGYFPLRTGDRVRFQPINERTFRAMAGRRLCIA